MANTTVKRIEAGHYEVSDGRVIVKIGSSWFVLNSEGGHDLGPLPTLSSAKEYVTTGQVLLHGHNVGTQHGRRQSKKEFNAYLASEAKKGNPSPAILYFFVLIVLCIIFSLLDK
ncbi:hypothetical protein [Salinivibrio sp. SS2]|uniref:hypothetical protein n=1 Tax=Salinivibrio sp. SS2 TaxID=1892894 RepID=UPI00084CC024|nr:hypothetical protein [Salinivibrio sp. DV]ODQ00552.1 hypothetical protein BGK46_06445 [Salinivibrio sp. DV]